MLTGQCSSTLTRPTNSPSKRQRDPPLLAQADCTSLWLRHRPWKKPLAGHRCRWNCQQVPCDFSDQRVRFHVGRPSTKWTLVSVNRRSCDVQVQLVLNGFMRATRLGRGRSIAVQLCSMRELEGVCVKCYQCNMQMGWSHTISTVTILLLVRSWWSYCYLLTAKSAMMELAVVRIANCCYYYYLLLS